MVKVGLLSDTHSFLDDKILSYFNECDEIWHAGDIGDEAVLDRLLATGKTIRAVWGNADSQAMRLRCPENQNFDVEGVSVWMTHIGGYPGKWPRKIYSKLLSNPVTLFVCGHSHICKVMFDHNLQTLAMNPGAAGRYGIQSQRTILRFVIESGHICDLEVIELA